MVLRLVNKNDLQFFNDIVFRMFETKIVNVSLNKKLLSWSSNFITKRRIVDILQSPPKTRILTKMKLTSPRLSECGGITSGTNRSSLAAVVLINGLHPREVGILINEGGMKKAERWRREAKRPYAFLQRACFLIKFLLTEIVSHEKVLGEKADSRSRIKNAGSISVPVNYFCQASAKCSNR